MFGPLETVRPLPTARLLSAAVSRAHTPPLSLHPALLTRPLSPFSLSLVSLLRPPPPSPSPRSAGAMRRPLVPSSAVLLSLLLLCSFSPAGPSLPCLPSSSLPATVLLGPFKQTLTSPLSNSLPRVLLVPAARPTDAWQPPLSPLPSSLPPSETPAASPPATPATFASSSLMAVHYALGPSSSAETTTHAAREGRLLEDVLPDVCWGDCTAWVGVEQVRFSLPLLLLAV